MTATLIGMGAAVARLMLTRNVPGVSSVEASRVVETVRADPSGRISGQVTGPLSGVDRRVPSLWRWSTRGPALVGISM